jgi:prefoldin subunit 5
MQFTPEEVQTVMENLQDIIALSKEVTAEVDRLRAENAELRKALESQSEFNRLGNLGRAILAKNEKA